MAEIAAAAVPTELKPALAATAVTPIPVVESAAVARTSDQAVACPAFNAAPARR